MKKTSKSSTSSKTSHPSKLPTIWNLSLLYRNDRDPQIERDMKSIESSCDAFAKKWSQDTGYVTSLPKLLTSLTNYKNLNHIVGDAKPVMYFFLARDINSEHPQYAGRISKLQERITRATNGILFYEIELGKISAAMRTKIAQDKKFDDYAYFLKKIWDQTPHRLSADVERVMAMKSEPAYVRWVDGSKKLIAQQTVTWRGNIVPIHEAVGMIGTLPKPADRKKLHSLITAAMKSVSYFAEAELNAIVTDKKISDEIRGFTHPYSATILDYENTETEVMSLIGTIGKRQNIAHRLYAIKARLMGLDRLHYSDLGVTLAASKQVFSFEQGVVIIRRAFAKIDQTYVDIFDRMLKNGQIDVYARVGKEGGGYCAGAYNQPTYILLNWTNDLHSVTTLAHEMGHAIHRELSKTQHVLYESHPISTAEVASTLFENFVFDELLLEMNQADRMYARYNRLQDAVATVFRQGAYFGYECDLHAAVRKTGYVSADDMAGIMHTNLKKHLGNAFDLTTDDGYLFVRYMHARWFFYVYSYAYGQLISTALYARYQADPAFITSINQFLSSGGSASPETIFARIGINTGHSDFWKTGIDAIDQQLRAFERDARAQGMLKK